MNVELLIDVLDVRSYGFGRYEQALGELPLVETIAEKVQDVEFSWRQRVEFYVNRRLGATARDENDHRDPARDNDCRQG